MADKNHDRHPPDYRQTVLLALCGLSPAVITETLWALARENPPVRVDKVVALTTVQGRDAIKRELFEGGVWHSLRNKLNAGENEMVFGGSGDCIRVIPDAGAEELEDIISSADSLAAADFLLESLRQFTENPECTVIFSIAGGRKTMSALAALCMTLLGRQKDRLCHVLVNPPFDSPLLKPRFFFPDTETRHHHGNTEYSSSDADISLHDIPYVRCREVFRREYNRLPGSFLNTVNLANKNLMLPSIEVDIAGGRILINNEMLDLSPAEYAFFWLLCERRWEEIPPIDNASEAFFRLAEFVQRADVRGVLPAPERSGIFSRMLAGEEAGKIVSDHEQAAFVRHLADRLKRKLKNLPSLPNSEPLYPSRGRNKGYGLDVPTENITMSE